MNPELMTFCELRNPFKDCVGKFWTKLEGEVNFRLELFWGEQTWLFFIWFENVEVDGFIKLLRGCCDTWEIWGWWPAIEGLPFAT